MPSNTFNLLRVTRRGLLMSIIGAVVALVLLWRRKRLREHPKGSPKCVGSPPPACASQASTKSNLTVPLPQKSETSTLGTASTLPETAVDVEQELPADSSLSPSSGKSKRQEKKEQRKEAQKRRDVEQPKVRTFLDRYKAFVEACVEHAGMTVEDVTEAFIEKNYPKKFESHGHVVVVQLNGSSISGAPNPTLALTEEEAKSLEDFRKIAKAFAKSLQTPTDVVIVDTRGIGGELRKPIHEIVWHSLDEQANATGSGSSSAQISAEKCFAPIRAAAPKEKYEAYVPSISFATHIENKTKYSFDVMKVMFSSGNSDIRMHFGSAVKAAGETVVDMFAGIGYFTIPLAMHGGLRHLHALEKNPDSAEFLQMNAYQNNVADRVTVYCGDNREVTGDALDGLCDRVLMGYIPCCKEFIPKAVQFLKRETFLREVEEEVEEVKPSELPSSSAAASASPSPSPQQSSKRGRGGRRGNKDSSAREEKPPLPSTTGEEEEEVAEAEKEMPATNKIIKKVTKEVTRPVGVIHYHFLAGKDDSEAVAMSDIAHALSEEKSHRREGGHDAMLRPDIDYKVTHMFQVKSYSPKMWHYVADVTFGGKV